MVKAINAQQPLIVPVAEGERLREWVIQEGGFVHPSLVVVDHAPCGCRGVVAGEAIEDVDALIAVPGNLNMTAQAACTQLQPMLAAGGAKSIERLGGILQLSVLLAHERSKGQSSYWHPYIAVLPQQPPNAWMMEEAELLAALQQLGPAAAGWGPAVLEARQTVDSQAAAVGREYGRILSGVDKVGMRWAMGQVLSRCFGAEGDLRLAPFIDVCNHHRYAASPRRYSADSSDCTYAVVSSSWQGQQRPLNVGDELYINYDPNTPPLPAFLSFGFVPEELMDST